MIYFREDYTDFEWYELLKKHNEDVCSNYGDVFDRYGEIREEYGDLFNINIYIV